MERKNCCDEAVNDLIGRLPIGDDGMLFALRQIAAHKPRKHSGRRRSFINWQYAYLELQGIAQRAVDAASSKTRPVMPPNGGVEPR